MTRPAGSPGTARMSRLEDYLYIGGPSLSAGRAAARLGVTIRTIERYKDALRAMGQLPPLPPLPPVERPGAAGPGWCGCGCGRRTPRLIKDGRTLGAHARVVRGHHIARPAEQDHAVAA